MHKFLYIPCLFIFISCASTKPAGRFQIVEDGNAKATIVVSANPSPAASLAAVELQHHLQLVTGALLPVRSDQNEIHGNKILIGDSRFTKALGYVSGAFGQQEYTISFHDENLVLYGKDWFATYENLKEHGRNIIQIPLGDSRVTVDYNLATYSLDKEAKKIILPGTYDDQGSLYATYDLIERELGIRWYGPADFNIVIPKTRDVALKRVNRRRSPAMKYRDGTDLNGPIISVQFGHAGKDAVELFHRRMRKGGEKWGANHSLSSYQDRFLIQNPGAPKLFERKKEEYFAVGRTGNKDERQFCYSNQSLINQVVADARSYFDGNGVKGAQIAIGDYFAVLPLDNDRWCLCEQCQSALANESNQFNHEHFSSGIGSDYIFGFINSIADSLAHTHPEKKIATLAYHVYSYYPDDVKLRSNISVSPCLHSRHYMSPGIRDHELGWYKKWVEKSTAPLYVWNYNTFPTERGVFGFGSIDGKTPWNVFPGFSAHAQAQLIRMFHEDSVRGVFLCGVGEQLDYYLAMKHYDDPGMDVDFVLDEFFRLYFGKAAEPMRKFYGKIETVYNDFSLYPERVKGETHYHQDEEIAWRYLGTEDVMHELEQYITRAKGAELSPVERKRVESWESGIWKYMEKGKTDYLRKIEK